MCLPYSISLRLWYLYLWLCPHNTPRKDANTREAGRDTLAVELLSMYKLAQKLIRHPQKESGFLLICQNDSVERNQV